MTDRVAGQDPVLRAKVLRAMRFHDRASRVLVLVLMGDTPSAIEELDQLSQAERDLLLVAFEEAAYHAAGIERTSEPESDYWPPRITQKGYDTQPPERS